jgi:hypothetical protein
LAKNARTSKPPSSAKKRFKFIEISGVPGVEK